MYDIQQILGNHMETLQQLYINVTQFFFSVSLKEIQFYIPIDQIDLHIPDLFPGKLCQFIYIICYIYKSTFN